MNWYASQYWVACTQQAVKDLVVKTKMSKQKLRILTKHSKMFQCADYSGVGQYDVIEGCRFMLRGKEEDWRVWIFYWQ